MDIDFTRQDLTIEEIQKEYEEKQKEVEALKEEINKLQDKKEEKSSSLLKYIIW